MSEKTYPCVVGGRIVELTEAQRRATEWRCMSSDEKIAVLLQRVESLEREVQSLRSVAWSGIHINR